MTKLTLRIELKSDALIGTGEGWGATIDSDIVFDDLGLPYIPAKRIKGCLRESALEVAEMFELSKLDDKMIGRIHDLLGSAGSIRSAPLEFSNCYLKDYSLSKKWLEWVNDTKKSMLSKEVIANTFTSIKQHTAIENDGIAKGTAKEHSLRTYRVLKKGNEFFGKICFNKIDEYLYKFLIYSVKNMRYLGTSRNRGLGLIRCELLDSESNNLCEKFKLE